MTELDKKKGRGRPTILAAKKRLPEVRVTEDQLKTYKTASKRSGMTYSAWVRDALDRSSK